MFGNIPYISCSKLNFLWERWGGVGEGFETMGDEGVCNHLNQVVENRREHGLWESGEICAPDDVRDGESFLGGVYCKGGGGGQVKSD